MVGSHIGAETRSVGTVKVHLLEKAPTRTVKYYLLVLMMSMLARRQTHSQTLWSGPIRPWCTICVLELKRSVLLLPRSPVSDSLERTHLRCHRSNAQQLCYHYLCTVLGGLQWQMLGWGALPW